MLDSSCSIVLGSLGLPVKCETSSFLVAPILTCVTAIGTIVLVLSIGLQEEPLRLGRLLLLFNLTMVSLVDFCNVKAQLRRSCLVEGVVKRLLDDAETRMFLMTNYVLILRIVGSATPTIHLIFPRVAAQVAMI